MNMTKGLLSSPESMSLDVVNFDEPSPFELDDLENPFDLDDSDVLPETVAATVKFLVRLALAEGNFSDLEKQLIFQVLQSVGETVSQSHFERLAQQASREPLDVILSSVSHQPASFREKLLLSGMLLTGVDGRVDTIEKKLLVQSCQLLGISRQRYSEIARDAVHLIKTRKAYLSGNPPQSQITAAPQTGTTIVKKLMTQPDSEAVATRQIPSRHAGPKSTENLVSSSKPPSGEPIEKPSVNKVLTQKRASASPSEKPAEFLKRAEWRCPACNMPQFREFDECPQCGIIVSKFKAIVARNQPTEEYIDVPTPDLQDDTVSTEPHIHGESELPSNCPSCEATLRPGAKFCHSCGNRIQ
jgi:tellurite resistance protein